MPTHIAGMTEGQLSSMRLPLTEIIEEAAIHSTAGMGHITAPGGTFSCNQYALKGCGGADPNG